MKWNVYVYDFNQNKIEVYNIFKHGSFMEDIKKAYRECKSKDEFAEQLKKAFRYYYWSKCEWEVIISPWLGRKNSCDLKIDVYSQVANNWHVFLDYVYNNIEEILEWE